MSTPPSRDRALEHLLRHRTPAAPAMTPACADPETLAAWIEGGLDAHAMAETERHLSDCARCQAMLAAIVRSEPETPAAESWWPRMHLRWLVPLSAAAAATVLWMVVPAARPDVPVAEPETTRARGELGAPAPAAEPSSTQQEKAERAAPATASPSAAPASPAPPVQLGNEAREAPSSSDQARPGAAADRAREETPAERQALAKQTADPLARSDQRRPEALQESVQITGAAPAAEAPRAARAMPPSPAPSAVGGAVAGFADSVGPTIPSQDAVVRWRLVGTVPPNADMGPAVDGMVERSDDGGATWRRVSTGVLRRFTAGYAPSAAVCWLVGPGGTVVLTTDARTWRQLAVPAPDANLTSVEASDASTATVRDTAGRAFRTTDGGATWSAVP